jgi:uncharacterized lipoprotein YddW (UPF0748 family)
MFVAWRGVNFPVHADEEVRALWVVRTTLTSPSAIAAMVSAAKASGFNTLLVQVRGRGDAYYQGGLEPRPPALASAPDFDPLSTTIARAHAVGLRVHAWMNVNLVSSAVELPAAREHVIYRHPEWLMVPRALAEDLVGVESRSPEYLGRLARYVRNQRNGVEGLYLSPISQDAALYSVAIARDIAARYAIDGVHFDYIRYPNDQFDYSRDAVWAFRRTVVADLKPADQRRYDARLADEPLIYSEAFPERWSRFRAAALTTLLSQLKQAVRTAQPAARVSVAVVPDPSEAATARFQNWVEWLRGDLIDVACLMAYTTDRATFASQIAAARNLAEGRPVWAGIGAYRLSPGQTVENIRAARRLGMDGVILFSYDSLIEPSRGPDYLRRGRCWSVRSSGGSFHRRPSTSAAARGASGRRRSAP